MRAAFLSRVMALRTSSPNTSAAQPWRVSWNPGATALAGARSVELFVRDGDDQARIDLSPNDLHSASYQYPPKSKKDVTFRLEVSDGAGRVSAESFRVVATAPSNPAPDTAARVIHKVAPAVPASVRPRIKGSIPIDVLVYIDARGAVTSATPANKPRSGLETYLAARAVSAARQWRFDPAREDGEPVASRQSIHFSFKR